RKFQESIVSCDIDAVEYAAYGDPAPVTMEENDADAALGALESRLSEILSQTTKEDDEFQAQQEIYKNVQRELSDCERKVSLMNMIVTETKELQDLTIYPFKS
ncbi:myosin-11-like protein, partial [Trifolium pratense]